MPDGTFSGDLYLEWNDEVTAKMTNFGSLTRFSQNGKSSMKLMGLMFLIRSLDGKSGGEG